MNGCPIYCTWRLLSLPRPTCSVAIGTASQRCTSATQDAAGTSLASSSSASSSTGTTLLLQTVRRGGRGVSVCGGSVCSLCFMFYRRVVQVDRHLSPRTKAPCHLKSSRYISLGKVLRALAALQLKDVFENLDIRLDHTMYHSLSADARYHDNFFVWASLALPRLPVPFRGQTAHYQVVCPRNGTVV